MDKIFYIDPQSYNNLAVYDSNLISGITNFEIEFYGNKLFNGKLSNRIKFHPIFKYSTTANPILKALSYLKSIILIKYAIKTVNPQIIHIQWLRLWHIDYLFLLWNKMRGIKTVFTAHNILPHDTGDKYFTKYLKYYQKVDHIIVHERQTKSLLKDRFGISENKISVIRHGVLNFDIDQTKLTERILELRRELDIKNDDIVFSSLGVQSKYKGVDNLITVWETTPLLNNNKKCKLLLIGKAQGIEYSSIKNIDNVIIKDCRLSDIDFQAYLNLSSVILLPYRQISQSGVLLNAISAEIPVVVSDIGGLSEPLEFGNIGWNIGESTIENLRYCLTNIVSNPAEILQKRNPNIFKIVKNKYNWSAISHETESIYASLLSN